MCAEILPYSIYIPSLVLIAQVVFLLQRVHTQTHKVTDYSNHTSVTACVGKLLELVRIGKIVREEKL